MAVSFNTGENYGYSILSLFGVPPAAIDLAKVAGVKMSMASPGNFHISSQDGTNLTVVSIKAQAISLAKAGSLGPASAASIKHQLTGALSKAIGQDVSTLPESAVPANPIQKPKVTPVNPLGMMTGKKPETVSPVVKDAAFKALKPSEGHIIPPPPKASSHGSLVALSDADEVYQPVKGTSKSSVYYVVARLKGLNVAIRSKTTSLSVRAEGTKLHDYAGALTDLGFDIKSSYASVHFDCTGSDLKMKTVGAIVGRLGMDNLVQAADVSKLVNA